MTDIIFMMPQTFSEAVYSMLHLLPEKEQKETYDKFVYEFGRADFEINTAESLLNEFKYLYRLKLTHGAKKLQKSRVSPTRPPSVHLKL